eukprot:CAMPEP_0172557292 /NCGR_PEP_ID=MMETSP1067-20121228/72460_1 /TAXON_ID=265564 ORGANISM="Thalassiosira punctigera, Strain Tpunct2005C2" /NCGR_SAMPLE_ID=MMETSP1067 /ASSEMBLY_ACC=CAM_ASM_000444 /LENGTH=54 /DNA_ID=CAMNT_0013346347 /DNA_START=1 /DNA_END=161 /DNA_ORIENTATION=+
MSTTGRVGASCRSINSRLSDTANTSNIMENDDESDKFNNAELESYFQRDMECKP